MRNHERATTWIDVEVTAATDRAVLVDYGGKEEVWIPKSQIIDSEDDLVIGKSTKIEITERLATEKGLV